jgi:hypothetical protein
MRSPASQFLLCAACAALAAVIASVLFVPGVIVRYSPVTAHVLWAFSRGGGGFDLDARARGPWGVDGLERGLASPDQKVRSWSAYALSLSSDAGRGILLADVCRDDPDPLVRYQAIRSSFILLRSASRPVLESALADSDNLVRETARRYLQVLEDGHHDRTPGLDPDVHP